MAIIETIGRRSGRPIRTPVGFVEDADGSLLVAAGSPDTAWGLNLLEDGRCRVRIGEAERPYVATELDRTEHARAIRELILRYGTPAERLGAGPAFRLVPA